MVDESFGKGMNDRRQENQRHEEAEAKKKMLAKDAARGLLSRIQSAFRGEKKLSSRFVVYDGPARGYSGSLFHIYIHEIVASAGWFSSQEEKPRWGVRVECRMIGPDQTLRYKYVFSTIGFRVEGGGRQYSEREDSGWSDFSANSSDEFMEKLGALFQGY